MKLFIAVSFFATLCASLGAEITNCPNYCRCAYEGSSGVSAVCAKLDPKEQHFYTLVQHLIVISDTPFSLTDNVFSNLGLKSLESIRIVNSSLTNVSMNAFQDMNELFEVDLSNNQLFLIHAETFANNTNLHQLSLAGNPLQLTQLLHSPNDYLLRSSSLSELDLSNCQLTQILPKTFSQLRNLLNLRLSSNMLRSVPKNVFDSLKYIEELDLSNNQITKIDKDTFANNQELMDLKLQNNPIEFFSGMSLTNLEVLDLSECKLKLLLREMFEGMSDLTDLKLGSNMIDVVSDDTFVDLTKLKHLDLSNNRLVGPLPSDLFRANRELMTLSLSGNVELAPFVDEGGFNETHLALLHLDLSNCGLKYLLPSQLSGLDNLNTLNLSDNAINKLDVNVFKKLENLATLDLSKNLLETLDYQIFLNNAQLVKLKLSDNPIKHLPLFAFTHTQNLKFLDASSCLLESLWDVHKHEPDDRKILPNLAYLDVSNNDIKALHINDFTTLERLEKVDLSGNPLQCVKSTIKLVEWFIVRQIDPFHQNMKISADGGNDIKWSSYISDICPVKESPPVKNTSPEPAPVIYEDMVDEIVVKEDPPMWPMVLVISVLVAVLYCLIYVVGEIVHRRRKNVYTGVGSLAGQVRSRSITGSQLYYKLYEECSVPAEPVKTKSKYINLSPIHKVLKKGTYKFVKNGEVHV